MCIRDRGRFDELFLQDYLQDVALLTDADSDGDKDEPRVSLMTVHAAKGLEFPTVFVVGLEENIFPSPLSAASLRELEEERRLLYVAITRAEKHCILTNAKNRWRYGKMEFDNPSRFIDEMCIRDRAGSCHTQPSPNHLSYGLHLRYKNPRE